MFTRASNLRSLQTVKKKKAANAAACPTCDATTTSFSAPLDTIAAGTTHAVAGINKQVLTKTGMANVLKDVASATITAAASDADINTAPKCEAYCAAESVKNSVDTTVATCATHCANPHTFFLSTETTKITKSMGESATAVYENRDDLDTVAAVMNPMLDGATEAISKVPEADIAKDDVETLYRCARARASLRASRCRSNMPSARASRLFSPHCALPLPLPPSPL